MILPRQFGLTFAISALLLGAGVGSSAGARTVGESAAPAPRSASSFPDGDWTRFDYDAQRSGVGPADTGITRQNLGLLTLRQVTLDGTVDSTPIQLHAVKVHGRKRDVVMVTTTYGRTIALDPGTGAKLWEYVPSDIHSYEGSAQITTATPIADPDRAHVYAASPDGRIHKLELATGHEIRSGGWPVSVTFDPTHEKIASALNISGSSVVVTTGGYIGDIPPYQGHVVMIDRTSGQITAVWNSLCSNRHYLIDPPSSCPSSDSAIWARAGAVIEPGTGRILVATGNGSFNGSNDWGDSVLELSPHAHRLLHNWTPTTQAQLDTDDLDLGSTAPAILPEEGGFRLAVQSGKDGILRLLDLNRLDGTTGPAGPRLGGELQDIAAPQSNGVFTAPAVWRHAGKTYVFVGTGGASGGYVLKGSKRPRLHSAWQHGFTGTSPLVAGGLLYLYDTNGSIRVLDPASGNVLHSLPLGSGHWQSPIVIGGRVVEAQGNANLHQTHGVLDIYHLPGR